MSTWTTLQTELLTNSMELVGRMTTAEPTPLNTPQLVATCVRGFAYLGIYDFLRGFAYLRIYDYLKGFADLRICVYLGAKCA